MKIAFYKLQPIQNIQERILKFAIYFSLLIFIPSICYADTKVYFANGAGYGNNGEPNYVECFIAGYESAGGHWAGDIKLDSFVSGSEIHGYVLPYMQANGFDLMLRPSMVSGYNHVTVDSFYHQGIQIITCAGSNNYHALTYLLPLKNIIVCGAGDTCNTTSYHCEFYTWHPYNSDPFFFQSYAHAYIGGQLTYIKDVLHCSWWEARCRARVTATGNNVFDIYNGFGRIRVEAAIEFNGSIPEDPYDILNGTALIDGTSNGFEITLRISPVNNALKYIIYNNKTVLLTVFALNFYNGVFTFSAEPFMSSYSPLVYYKAVRGSQIIKSNCLNSFDKTRINEQLIISK